ncbi:MAG: hypothetical protein ACK4N5_03350, partial [Myxococcales bacterium]
ESTLEDLNRGTTQVHWVRREYQCPTGELVNETRCAPCEVQTAEWVERPHDVWLTDLSFANEDQQAEAMATLEHLKHFFELENRGGGEKAGVRHVFWAWDGKKKAAPEPSKAVRVRMFVEENEATAAIVRAGATGVEVVARAQHKGITGGLEEFDGAKLTFTSACGTVKELGPGRVLYSLAPGVARCELKATAHPGGAVAAIGVTREAEVDIAYQGQTPDHLVLEGADVLELDYLVRGTDVQKVRPAWSAKGGRLEVLEDGDRVKFRLDRGADRAEIRLLDEVSGAGDVVTVQRKAR